MYIGSAFELLKEIVRPFGDNSSIIHLHVLFVSEPSTNNDEGVTTEMSDWCFIKFECYEAKSKNLLFDI